MYHYIVYSAVLLVFSFFTETATFVVFASDDRPDDAHPSMSLAPAPVAGAAKRGRDEGETQRKQARRGAGDAAAASRAAEAEADEEDGGEEARAFAALAGEQVYANPIFDAAVKYLFEDAPIRLGFMKTFTGNPHIVSTELLDNSLNPLRTFTQARAFLGDRGHADLMERVRRKSADRLKVVVKAEDDEEEDEELKEGGAFLLELSKIFGDLKKKFPPLERHSQLDVVCQLDNGEFILVEVQVKPQDFWDKRALCYAAAFYGNQLKRGGDWGDLKKVIAINLLGGQGKHWKKDPELIRHYKFTSEVGGHRHEIDSLQLIQYNLLSPKIDGLGEIELKEWLDFWRGAHQRKADEVAGVATPAVRSAYDRVRVAALPGDVKAGYEANVAEYLRYSQHIEHEKAESRKAGVEEGIEKEKLRNVQRMLAKGLSDAYINELADLKEGELDKIKERLKDAR